MAATIASSKDYKTLRVSVDGLGDVSDLISGLPEQVSKAKELATIGATRFAFAESSRKIRREIRVTPEYLGSAANGGNRLKISYAFEGSARIGVIKGRKRATSLARFILGGVTFGAPKGGTRIQVKPGGRVQTGVAVRGGSRSVAPVFAVKLNKGKSLTEDNYNVGLAVRLKPGEILQRKTEHKDSLLRADKHGEVALLYGPSINQVFYDVAPEIAPSVGNKLEDEFLRQLVRFTGE